MNGNANVALSKAINQDNMRRFNFILNHQKWPHNLSWSNYQTLVFQSIMKDREIMANLLIDKGYPVEKDLNKSDVMFRRTITKFGQFEKWSDILLTMMKRHKIRVSHQNEAGDTIIHLAYTSDVCNRLMEQFLQIYLGETNKNLVNVKGFSVLHIVCTRSLPGILQKFYKHRDIDINIQVPIESGMIHAGYTPLHLAVDYGRIDMVKSLLDHQADIYVLNKYLSTPLHLACKVQDMEMVNLILQYDSFNENYTDKSGLSHFMIACAGTETVIPREYLRVAQIRPWTSPEALINGHVKKTDQCGYAGYTALHFAAEFGQVDTVKLLLQHDIDNEILHDEVTPLSLAYQRGHNDICDLLDTYYRALMNRVRHTAWS